VGVAVGDPHRAVLDALLQGARAGDEQAFAELYRTLQPRLLRYLRMRCGDAWQDVASETWLRVVRDLHRFRGDSAGFTSWLFTIARYRAIDAARSAAPATEELPDDIRDERDLEDRLVNGIASTERVRTLLAQLPPEQAETVALRCAAGLDIATVASLLGKSETAVRVSAHRGLRRLASLIGPDALEEVG
jgi:RNA polymerase sigma-70 factor (ECF subfamily)